MDPTSLEITEGEERDGQVTFNIANPEMREGRNPFEVLPHLVWLEISYKVQEPQDWHNLYSASSKLKDLLEKDKFARILPVISPHVCKYLDRKDMINICGADRKYASPILSWLQMRCLDPARLGQGWTGDYDENGNEIHTYLPGTGFDVYFDSEENIQEVTNELLDGGSDSSIPFGIRFLGGVNEVEYWQSAKRFLQLFGTRTWGCKFVFLINGNEDPGHFHDLLIQCLRLIPNVVYLRLVFTYVFEPPPNRIPLADPSILPLLDKLKVLGLAKGSGPRDNGGGGPRDNGVRVLRGDQLTGWRTEVLALI